MRSLDFSSWHTLLSTLFGLSVITLIGVGIRLMAMQLIQQRRERDNRQINERLRTLIAAYKTLGGSFTGDLAVDPSHLRDVRQRQEKALAEAVAASAAGHASLTSTAAAILSSAERPRRIRDAVEAALSDIILLGTEEQVELAARAATELSQSRPIHTAELVISLRNFIRQVLDLEPIPASVAIPRQGPTRVAASRGKAESAGKADAEGGSKKGGGGSGGMGGMGGGAVEVSADEPDADHHH